MPIAALAAPLIELGLPAFAAEGLVGAGLGAGGGALLGEVTGSKDIGLSALGGALGGGITGGLAGPLGSALGSSTAGGVLAGGLGGLASGAVSGTNPLLSAAGGAALGGVTSGFGGGDSSAPGGAAPTSGAPASAAAIAAPAASPFGTLGSADVASFGALPANLGSAPTTAGFGSSTLPSVAPLSAGGDIGSLGGGGAAAPTADVGSIAADAGPASGGYSPGGGGFLGGLFGGGSGGGGGAATIGTATDISGNPVPIGSDAATDFSSGGTAGGAGGSIWNWLKNNPGILLGGGLLGTEALLGQQPYPQETQIQALATQAQNQAAALAAPSATGILPPGEQAAVDLAVNASKGQIAGTYGNLGLSGSTMEAQAMQGADLEAAALKANIANRLLSTSAEFSQIAGQDYSTVLNAEVARDAAFQRALALFAAGLAGGRINPAAA